MEEDKVLGKNIEERTTISKDDINWSLLILCNDGIEKWKQMEKRAEKGESMDAPSMAVKYNEGRSCENCTSISC